MLPAHVGMILTLVGRVKLKFEGCDTVNKSLLPRRMRDDRPIFYLRSTTANL